MEVLYDSRAPEELAWKGRSENHQSTMGVDDIVRRAYKVRRKREVWNPGDTSTWGWVKEKENEEACSRS